MKKMLTLTAALALMASVVQADVFSSNVVGYQKLDLAGKHAMVSSTFATIGAQGETFTLGEIKAEGMDPFGDTIQVLDLSTAKTVGTYAYVDAAAAAGFGDPSAEGWWDVTLLGQEGGKRDELPITAGQGFLCNVGSANVKLLYTGEVVAGGKEVVLLGKHHILSNLLPMEIELGDIEAVGMDPFGDTIQDLDLSTAKTVSTYAYVDAAAAAGFGDPSAEGWWDVTLLGQEGGKRDDVIVAPGQGFLCNIGSPNVSFIFPDPLPEQD